MCGLPFSGKSVLAEALSRELRIRLLSYDHGIYPVHSRSAPAGSSVASEYDFVQAIARREIAAVAEAHWAGFVLVYLDTPLPVIDERRAANSGTRRRASIPEASMRSDVSVLEPPQDAERAIYVSPDYVLADVLARVNARL